MKKILIAVLVCVNLALLAALMLGSGAPMATGQVAGGGTDYLVTTAQYNRGNVDALYILDLGKRRLAGWTFDKDRGRLVQFRGRKSLTQDFRRETTGQ